jgi:regulator of cell morphogenesis and NO signaling
MHMFKKEKERILFAAVVAAELAASCGAPLPGTPLGPLGNPIGMMEAARDSARESLAQTPTITGNFAIPDYARVTYRELMNGLQKLEQDLHLRIHLEDNILFPRTTKLDSSRGFPAVTHSAG